MRYAEIDSDGSDRVRIVLVDEWGVQHTALVMSKGEAEELAAALLAAESSCAGGWQFRCRLFEVVGAPPATLRAQAGGGQ